MGMFICFGGINTAAILEGGGPVEQVCVDGIDNTNGSLLDVLNDNSTFNIQVIVLHQ